MMAWMRLTMNDQPDGTVWHNYMQHYADYFAETKAQYNAVVYF
jgi:hypothetical protein